MAGTSTGAAPASQAAEPSPQQQAQPASPDIAWANLLMSGLPFANPEMLAQASALWGQQGTGGASAAPSTLDAAATPERQHQPSSAPSIPAPAALHHIAQLGMRPPFSQGPVAAAATAPPSIAAPTNPPPPSGDPNVGGGIAAIPGPQFRRCPVCKVRKNGKCGTPLASPKCLRRIGAWCPRAAEPEELAITAAAAAAAAAGAAPGSLPPSMLLPYGAIDLRFAGGAFNPQQAAAAAAAAAMGDPKTVASGPMGADAVTAATAAAIIAASMSHRGRINIDAAMSGAHSANRAFPVPLHASMVALEEAAAATLALLKRESSPEPGPAPPLHAGQPTVKRARLDANALQGVIAARSAEAPSKLTAAAVPLATKSGFEAGAKSGLTSSAPSATVVSLPSMSVHDRDAGEPISHRHAAAAPAVPLAAKAPQETSDPDSRSDEGQNAKRNVRCGSEETDGSGASGQSVHPEPATGAG